MAANLTLSNKNPFSTFDFLGYFIPGAFAIGLIYILSEGLQFDKELMPNSMIKLQSLIGKHEGYFAVMLVILSYVVGHLISYLSSVTIEQFYIWCYGYPTDYLLLSERKKESLIELNKFGCKCFWRIVICLLVLPLFMCHFVVERMLGVSHFLSKEMDDEMRNCLINRINLLAERVGHKKIDKRAPSTLDIHRIVMHYVYEHCQQHVSKYDNYVALYGFLRSITLIFNIAFLYVIYRFLAYCNHGEIIDCCSATIALYVMLIFIGYAMKGIKDGISNQVLCVVSGVCVILFGLLIHSSDGNGGEIVQMLMLFSLTYLSYLGYTKFYRRFTLENLMSLLVCKDETNTCTKQEADTTGTRK